MSTADRAYSPLAYHNGTVWPHDNSLICAGLARSGCWPEAQRLAHAMLEAAQSFGWQLPEVFSGLPRGEAPFPVPYPSSARPQAWAAGTPVLLLQTLLGLQASRARQTLDTMVAVELPSWAGDLRLNGIRAFDARWDVRLEDGRVSVDRI
jgi:glycogen debranching enzyme